MRYQPESEARAFTFHFHVSMSYVGCCAVVALCNIRAIIRAHADEFSFLLDITVDMSLTKLGITVLIHRKFNEGELE